MSTLASCSVLFLPFRLFFHLCNNDCKCERALSCPSSGSVLLCLEERWINVSALLWCKACFATACLWLIKHIDWPVSGLEGWPAAGFYGTTSPPSLSLSWRLKVKSSAGYEVMSAQYIWKHKIMSSSPLFYLLSLMCSITDRELLSFNLQLFPASHPAAFFKVQD